jgi:exosome complex exonuclease DIS3/RRP44
MAQYAGRASVNLHTHIFFKNKKTEEDGYILFVRQNALQILIPKYGLEGTLYIKSDSGFTFDEEEPSQKCGDVSLTLFMKVKVQLSLDQSNIQHEKLELKLVEPYIPGI